MKTVFALRSKSVVWEIKADCHLEAALLIDKWCLCTDLWRHFKSFLPVTSWDLGIAWAYMRDKTCDQLHLNGLKTCHQWESLNKLKWQPKRLEFTYINSTFLLSINNFCRHSKLWQSFSFYDLSFLSTPFWINVASNEGCAF